MHAAHKHGKELRHQENLVKSKAYTYTHQQGIYNYMLYYYTCAHYVVLHNALTRVLIASVKRRLRKLTTVSPPVSSLVSCPATDLTTARELKGTGHIVGVCDIKKASNRISGHSEGGVPLNFSIIWNC